MDSVLGSAGTGSGWDCGDDIRREGLEQFPMEDLVREPLWLDGTMVCWGEEGDEPEEEVEALFEEARLADFGKASHNEMSLSHYFDKTQTVYYICVRMCSYIWHFDLLFLISIQVLTSSSSHPSIFKYFCNIKILRGEISLVPLKTILKCYLINSWNLH